MPLSATTPTTAPLLAFRLGGLRAGGRATGTLYSVCTVVVLLVLWILVTDVLHLVPERELPSPLRVVGRLGELFVTPFGGVTLVGHLLASLGRWLLGVSLAIAIGVALGIALAWVPAVRAAVNPIFEFLRYIPPIAWIPLAVLWFGASTEAQAMVVFIAAFPPAVINSALGVRQADPLLEKAALTLGADNVRILRRVVIPVAAPAIFAGIRISIGNGWMALIGAELIASTEGLGYLIIAGQNDGSTPTIIAGMVCIGLVGVFFDAVVRRVQKLVLPWRNDGK